MKKLSVIILILLQFHLFSQNKSNEFDIVILDKKKRYNYLEIFGSDIYTTKYFEFSISSKNYMNLNKDSLGIIIHNSDSILIPLRSLARGGHAYKDMYPEYKPPYIGCPEILFENKDENLIIKIPFQRVCYTESPVAYTTFAHRYFLTRGKYNIKIYYKYYDYRNNSIDTVYSNAIPLYIRWL